MAGLFKTLFNPDKEAIRQVHDRATRQADRAVRAASALQETIRQMVDEDHNRIMRPQSISKTARGR